MPRLSKRQRLEATVAGQQVDRVPVSLWRHWPGDDQRSVDLARAILEFQHTYDFDFVKCMPASNYCVEDWGAVSTWVGNEEGTRQWGPRVIASPEDWAELRPLDPYRGRLAEALRALDLIGQGLEPGTPFVHTVFSPLYQAAKLAGDQLFAHLRMYPNALQRGLETITESTVRFIQAARGTGISGIFVALQHASYDLLSEPEYRQFGTPYDLRLLEAASGLWFNVLHLHGHNVMFDLVADYPVQALNWHDRETPPSLGEALPRFGGALIGGLHRLDCMLRGTPEQVEAQASEAIHSASGRRLVLGTGCVLQVNTPLGNILAARTIVEA